MPIPKFWLEVPGFRYHRPTIRLSLRKSTYTPSRPLKTLNNFDFPLEGIDLARESLFGNAVRKRFGGHHQSSIRSPDASTLPWPPHQENHGEEVFRGGIRLSVDHDLIHWLQRRFPLNHAINHGAAGAKGKATLSETKPEAARREARKIIDDGLSQAQPFRVASTLLIASREPAILQHLPETLMYELFRICKPEVLTKVFHEIITDYAPYGGSRRTWSPNHTTQKVVADVRTCLHTIFAQWRDSSHQCSLMDFRLLLSWARALGDGEAALELMDNMIAAGITPDTDCFNFYFEARCWNNKHKLAERTTLRIVPYALQNRRVIDNQDSRTEPFLGYRIGAGGLKQEIVTRFESMVQSGVPTNVTTYSMLILAMGREGDISGVKSLLKKVWNVDLDLILSDSTVDAYFPRHLHVDSPLYPDRNLLFTLAHVLGVNNDIQAALQLIDFISRHFGLDIDLQTWNELLVRTFALSTRANEQRKQHGYTVGKVPLMSFHELWDTMTSAPYNVTPTTGMHDLRFRAYARQSMLPEALHILREVVPPIASQTSFAMMLKRPMSGSFCLPSTNFLLFQARGRSYVVRRLRGVRDFVMFSYWFALLLSRAWKLSDPARREWRWRGIPDLVHVMWKYRPSRGFHYPGESGIVAFPHVEGQSVEFTAVGEFKPGLMVMQSQHLRKVVPGPDA